jgi:hypothetical protein
MLEKRVHPRFPVGHKNLGSGRDKVSSSSSLDRLGLGGHDAGSRPSTGRDTCFLNIVRGE